MYFNQHALLLVIIVVSGIIVLHHFYSVSTNENFQVDYDNTMTYLLTESPFRMENIILHGDSRDVNDSRMLNYFRSIFPFSEGKRATGVVDTKMVGYYPECAVSSLTKKKNLFVSLVGYQTLTLIIPRNSPLNESVDAEVWKGKRICTFKDSAASQTLRIIVTRLGLNVVIVDVNSYDDIYTLWKKGRIDGIFLLCSHPNLFVEKFSFQFEVSLFNFYKYFTSSTYRKNLIIFYFPSMFRSTIEMYSYRMYMNSKTIPSCSFYMVLYASPDVSDDFVFGFVNTLHKNFFYMTTHLPSLSHFSESTMQICPVDMEFHSGAKRYYTEKAVITEHPMNLSQYITNYSHHVDNDLNDRGEVLTLVARGSLG